MKHIPKIKLLPVPETLEARNALGYAWNDEAGTRHFLGGTPEMITGQASPHCSVCHEQMTFYAQIDSIGDAFDLADCMVIHTYVCFDCFIVESRLVQI